MLLVVAVIALLGWCPSVQAKTADLVLVLDGSDSISTEVFQATIQTMVDLVSSLDVSRYGDHVGVVLFSTDVSTAVGLTGNKQWLLSQIQQLAQPKLQSNAHKALHRMISMLTSSPARPQAAKIAMVFTDGSFTHEKLTEVAARLAKVRGIYTFGVGIGKDVNYAGLDLLASTPSGRLMSPGPEESGTKGPGPEESGPKGPGPGTSGPTFPGPGESGPKPPGPVFPVQKSFASASLKIQPVSTGSNALADAIRRIANRGSK